jgi:hypothetical protein
VGGPVGVLTALIVLVAAPAFGVLLPPATRLVLLGREADAPVSFGAGLRAPLPALAQKCREKEKVCRRLMPTPGASE